VDRFPKVSYLEQASPFSKRKLHQVCATPAVASQEKYIPRLAIWKRRRGVDESVLGSGFNVDELPRQASRGRAGQSGQVLGDP
jgi:hypothetical protein